MEEWEDGDDDGAIAEIWIGHLLANVPKMDSRTDSKFAVRMNESKKNQIIRALWLYIVLTYVLSCGMIV